MAVKEQVEGMPFSVNHYVRTPVEKYVELVIITIDYRLQYRLIPNDQ